MNRRAAASWLVLMAAGALFVACRQADAPGDRDELALGGQAYLAQCSVCHGLHGEGDGPLVASIVAEKKPQPVKFTEQKFRSLGTKGVERVLEGEAHRRPDAPMPYWGPHLGPLWTTRIARYVVSLPWLAERDRARVARYVAPVGATGDGRRTYVTYCSSCHGPYGEGEAFFTPVLGLVPRPFDSGMLRELNDDELAKFLGPGGPHVELAPNVPGWLYTISPAQRAELVAYLRVLDQANGN